MFVRTHTQEPEFVSVREALFGLLLLALSVVILFALYTVNAPVVSG